MTRWCVPAGVGLLSLFCLQSAAEPKGGDVDAACVVPAPLGNRLGTHLVRLQIRGADAHALGSGVVTISRSDGTGAVSVDCAKPQVLMRLAPGSYIATVDAAASSTKTLRFRVAAAQGSRTITLHFPLAAPDLMAR